MYHEIAIRLSHPLILFARYVNIKRNHRCSSFNFNCDTRHPCPHRYHKLRAKSLKLIFKNLLMRPIGSSRAREARVSTIWFHRPTMAPSWGWVGGGAYPTYIILCYIISKLIVFQICIHIIYHYVHMTALSLSLSLSLAIYIFSAARPRSRHRARSLGGVLGRPGGVLGASWARLGVVLGPSWESWGVLRASVEGVR